ncbi:MAG: hypothetical protein RLZZ373_2279 [Pseudomonadota bacterium]|jgi:hypothetical protein
MHRNWTAATPRFSLAALLLLASAAQAAAPCRGPAIPVQRLASGAWLVPGATGDTTPANRGAISNLLAVRDGTRLWLVGSGPSVAYARSLDCQLRRVTGLRVTDVVAPWPRPELVLGQAGLLGARRWAHEDVAAAMQERCPRCIERLRLRLGMSARDLGTGAVALPQHRLHGDSGTLGPLRWRRLQRAGTTTVTLWCLPRARLTTAHGLLWAEGAPDLRDADSAILERAWQQLAASGTGTGTGGMRWIPEQGPVQPTDAPVGHLQYLAALHTAVDAAQSRGTPESDPAPALPGVSTPINRSARHQLNWQHAWREAEARWMTTAPPPGNDGAKTP